MTNSRLALLTMFALPLPVIVALVSMHCHGAAITNDLRNAESFEEIVDLPARATTDGQAIASLIISPAAITGGKTSTGTIYLRYPAPAGGVAIALNNADPNARFPQTVTVPQGKKIAQFSIETKPVGSRMSVGIAATYQNATTSSELSIAPEAKSHWYVASNGSRTGRGTQSSPWDLATALGHGPAGEIKPGDTIWLRGGRYTGTFVSKLNGRAEAPIVVRAVPGERVILDKADASAAKQPVLKVKGSWVWFWGIEIMNSNPDRRRNNPYTGNDEPWRGSGADVYAPNVKFINMVFHNNGHGIWDKEDMTEVHGCLFFYNGNNKREHALYIGNSSGTKYITDNIVFDQGGYGILAHSNSVSSSQRGLHFEGNIAFNNGILTGDDQKTGNVQVGGVKGVSAERIVLKNNYIYNSASNANNKANGIRLGYEDTGNRDVQLLDNYIASKFPLLVWWWQSVELQGNTIYSPAEIVEIRMPDGIKSSTYRWDFNSYFSQARSGPLFATDEGTFGLPGWRKLTGLDRHSQALSTSQTMGQQVFVRPNRYEAGRANIVIYNWNLADQVAIDPSAVLTRGSNFEIRDAQNYLAEPVLRGVYKGGPLLLPMRLTAMPLPVGNVERIPSHTSSEFGVFVLQSTPAKPAD